MNLTIIGIVLLLALGVVGATVGGSVGKSSETQSSPGSRFNTSSAGSATALQSATPQLAREYVYAGSRMLNVEDSGAAAVQSPPDDLVVWRPGNGSWYILDSTNGTTAGTTWGGSGDTPLPADYDGDGQQDFCIFRPDASVNQGVWWIMNGATGSYSVQQWGLPTDKPVPADYDGDGLADVAVWRPSSGQWFVLQSASNTLRQAQAGTSADTPFPADYDGDGRADVAVAWQGGAPHWHILQSGSNNSYRSEQFGQAGDKSVRGDFDGDGRFDLAVRRNAANAFVYKSSATGNTVTLSFSSVQLDANDKTVAGDYDSDGLTDAAVWRPSNGTWYIRKSSNNQMRIEQWGQNGDEPVPAPMKR